MKKVKEYLESTRVQFEVIYRKSDGIGISHVKRIKDGFYFQKYAELDMSEIVVRGVSKNIYVSQVITHFHEDFIHVSVKNRVVFLYTIEGTEEVKVYTFMEQDIVIPINDIEKIFVEFKEEGTRILEIEENAQYINNYKGPQKIDWNA